MTSWFIFETLTGTQLQQFDPQSGSCSVRVNEAEEIEVTVPLTDPDLAALDWRSLASPWKASIAVEEHGRFYGGPILPHDFNSDSYELKLTARGIWTYFDHRFILPPAARTTPLVNAAGLPNTSLDTNISGFDLGTIAKKLVQQACAWPGANLPIVYQADRSGFRSRKYSALDVKTVGSGLTDITNVNNGPDIRFQLRRRDSLHFEWLMETGTEAQPRLQSSTIPQWDLAADQSSGSGLDVTTDPSRMADVSWATGGRNTDRTFVSLRQNTRLRDAGYPLLETLDSTHSEVEVQSTLDDYASEALRTAYVPAQFWSFKARVEAAPFLSEYAPGDPCFIHIEDNPYLQDGTYTRRIAALSFDEQGEWITITLGEVYDG